MTGPNDSLAVFTTASPGTYIVAVTYPTKSISSTTAPTPADVTCTFTTSLAGNTGASVLLKQQ